MRMSRFSVSPVRIPPVSGREAVSRIVARRTALALTEDFASDSITEGATDKVVDSSVIDVLYRYFAAGL